MSIVSKVIIAGSGFLVTRGIESFLKRDTRFSVVNILTSLQELLNNKHYAPDLLITDISSEGFNPEVLQIIKSSFPAAAILVVTDSISRTALNVISEAGIQNIILLKAAPPEILTAVHSALNGKKYYSSEILDMIIEPLELKLSGNEGVQLTVTEKEVVRQITGGLTTKEIARKRNISIHTVSTHRKNIFRKLGVSNSSELILKSIKAGWIDNIEYYI